MSNRTKTEKSANNELSRIIEGHSLLDDHFYSDDKNMSWDGYIYLYCKNQVFSKETFDDKIPVQIKGHIDTKKIYMLKEHIQYNVSIDDLNIYYHDRGVLYFQIFINNEENKKQVFYAILFPSKIKTYLNKAKEKGNKSTLKITFNALQNKEAPAKLYDVVRQFSRESRIQGFGLGQIVPQTLKFSDLGKMDRVTFNVMGTRNPLEMIKRLESGDICLYTIRKSDPYKIYIPIELPEKIIFFIGKVSHQSVKINDKIYYEQLVYERSSQSHTRIVFSENLSFDFSERNINFSARTSIAEIKRDCMFLREMDGKNQLYIGDDAVGIIDISENEQLQKLLDYYMDLSNGLEELNIKCNIDFSDLNDNDHRTLDIIVSLKNKSNHYLLQGYSLFTWKFQDKCYPILVISKENKNELHDAIYGEETSGVVSGDNGERYSVPAFGLLDFKDFSTLYKYDYEKLKKQIDDSDINSITLSYLNQNGLLLINTFDYNENKDLLNLAEYIYNKLLKIAPSEAFLVLNKMQIKVRKKIALSVEDSNLLERLKKEIVDNSFLCAICTLLKEEKQALLYYHFLKEEEKKQFREYPFYLLFKELCGKELEKELKYNDSNG